MRKPFGAGWKQAVAAGVAAGAALLLAGCASAPGHPPTRKVLLTSGTYRHVWWGVWAWEDGAGHLCLTMAGRGGPDATPKPRDADGGACGFARTPSYSHFYDSGPGPAGSYYNMGPVPRAATRIKVASRETLPTSPLPRGVGLPAGRYWVEILPASGLPSADGTSLRTLQPLDAAGQPVAFRAF